MARQHPGDTAARVAAARADYLANEQTVPALVLKGVGMIALLFAACIALAWLAKGVV